jgi:hypothetical protein
VGDDFMREVANFQKLEVLSLFSTSVTEGGLAQLAKCKTLRLIYIRNSTKITESEAKKLAEALPKCQIDLLGVKFGPHDKSVTPPQPDEPDDN